MEFLDYFEKTYIGQKVGGVRRPPKFAVEFWNVLDRHHSGSLRTCNAVESNHNAFVCGIVRAHHPSVFKFMEDIRSQQAIATTEMAEVNMGKIRKIKKKEEQRNRRLMTLVRKFEGDGDALHLCRGVAYNYL